MKEAKIEELRYILLRAFNAHAEMVVSDYDRGFHNGMAHSLYLLDEYLRSISDKGGTGDDS